MEREIITGIVTLIVVAVCLAIAGPWAWITDRADGIHRGGDVHRGDPKEGSDD